MTEIDTKGLSEKDKGIVVKVLDKLSNIRKVIADLREKNRYKSRGKK